MEKGEQGMDLKDTLEARATRLGERGRAGCAVEQRGAWGEPQLGWILGQLRI